MHNALRRFITSSTISLALTACQNSAAPATVITPSRALAIAGDGQTVVVGQKGSDSLAVVVYGTDGTLLPGAMVHWVLTDGRGTLSAATSTTDARGIARIAFTADTTAGVAHVSATTGTAAAVTLAELETPDAPARLIAMQPQEVSLTTGGAFTGALVRVVDRFGNAVQNVTLTLSEQNQGDDDFLSSTVIMTDGAGIASDTFTAGTTDGQRILTLTTDGGLSLSYKIDVSAASSGQ